MKSLTEKEQELFKQVLDLNHEMKIETKPIKKYELLGQLINAKAELKKEMGEERYEEFMSMGTKLFAPKNDDE